MLICDILSDIIWSWLVYVIQVFSKDCGPPSEQTYPARSVKRTAPSIGRYLELPIWLKFLLLGLIAFTSGNRPISLTILSS